MEPTPQGTETVGQPSSGQPLALPAVLPAIVRKPKSTPEQREAWKAKYREKVARKNGSPLSEPVFQVSQPEPSPDVAPSVPWSGDMLRPTTERVIDACEKASIDSLKEEAANIGDKALAAKLVAKVEQDAPWNPVSKATLKENVPAVIAKGLNALGIGSEHKEEVLSVMAAVEIYNGHNSLKETIQKIAAEHTAAAAPQAKAA